MYSQTGQQPMSPEVTARLVANHRAFLAFLEPRVSSRSVAEEILQNAFVRALEKGGALREQESAVAWFYRLLRNALIDHYRRDASEARAMERAAAPMPIEEDEIHGVICACMRQLLPTLKPAYAEILERVDLLGSPLQEVASAMGITANNAGVRLHRARLALRRQLQQSCGTCATHGCLDCSCGGGSGAAHSVVGTG